MAEAAAASTGSVPGPANRYIVSSLYDGVFFFYSPLIALALGTVLFYPAIVSSVNFPIELPWLNPSFSKPLLESAIKVFIQAHLVLVFLRSHLNPKIN